MMKLSIRDCEVKCSRNNCNYSVTGIAGSSMKCVNKQNIVCFGKSLQINPPLASTFSYVTVKIQRVKVKRNSGSGTENTCLSAAGTRKA